MAATRLSARDLTLLVLLTLFWGLNWPVMKIGVAELPPLYFRTLCIAGGLVVIWCWARVMRVPMTVSAGAWPLVLKLALPNLIMWHLLTIIAIKMLPSGRAAILGYTMPVWAVVIGLIAFNEKPLRRHWWGVLAALVGTLLLLSSEFTALAGAPLGTVLMLVAAASWGYGTHLMRRHLHRHADHCAHFLDADDDFCCHVGRIDRVRDASLANARYSRMGIDCLQHGVSDRVLQCRVVDAGAQAAARCERTIGNDDSRDWRFLGHGDAWRETVLAGLCGAHFDSVSPCRRFS